MAKKDTLKRLEAEQGDLHKIIPKLVNDGGQAYAAHQLNTTQATISRWLKTNGYEVQTVWALTADAKAALAAQRQNRPIERHARESEAVL